MNKKFPYFYTLIYINKYYSKTNNNVKIKRKEDLTEINNLIYNLYINIINEDDINKIISEILNTTGRILYMQPFYDGNSRTLKRFIKIIFNSLNYKFFYDKKDFLIPILFEEERCTENEINNFKKKVVLKKRSLKLPINSL